MRPERWQEVKAVLQSAIELSPDDRKAVLDDACGGDNEFRHEVESYLKAYDEADNYLDQPLAMRIVSLFGDSQFDLISGQQFGKYEIRKKLAAGGMGVVYQAIDRRLGRLVALKILQENLTQNEERLRRFRQEARAVSLLNHPNIITIHEVGETNGREFIVTEYVEGETLRRVLARGEPSLLKTLKIVSQIADALAAAHRAGIVHRDIKPENVMLRPDGYVKVLDFGLAKLTETTRYALPTEIGISEIDLAHTTPGLLMGTAAYISPEQAQGRAIDARTDIWSLGVILYEMVSGQRPFSGSTASHTIVSILEREPEPLPQHVPELQRIIWTALQKDADRRYQSIGAMLIDVNRLKQSLEYVSDLKTVAGDAVLDYRKLPEVKFSTETAEANPSPKWFSFKFSPKIAIALLIAAAGIIGLVFLPYTFLGGKAPQPMPIPSQSVQIDAAALKQEALEVLERWKTAMMGHDLDALTSIYADTLDVYQEQNDVSASTLRNERRKLFEKYSEIKIEISNEVVSLEPSGDAAEITFEMSYDYSHSGNVYGDVRRKLWLRRIDGHWLISGEKDLQVF